MTFENTVAIGNGIYTPKDISNILRIPPGKVRRWINQYWDGRLGKEYKKKYSWTVDGSKAVGFHTMIEFYTFIMLGELGVKTKQSLEAHLELSNYFKIAFPFANQTILENLKTDGKKVFLNYHGAIISLDGTNQINLDFIEVFFKNLDFDNELLASRFFPLGKDKSIIVDPKRQFGHPVLDGTNIYPETIYSMYQAGDSKKLISFAYQIDQKLIDDAIEYCKAA